MNSIAVIFNKLQYIGGVIADADYSHTTLPRETQTYHNAEAIAALHIAQRFRYNGNFKKAKNIIEHAYSLAPQDPDILTEYGLLIEDLQVLIIRSTIFVI